MPCPPKVKIFLWQILEESLPTAENLYKHHIIPSPICNLCGDIDTNTHCFIKCKMFDEVRKNLAFIHWKDLDFKHLISRANSKIDTTKQLIALWNMWKARNEAIFRNKPIKSMQIRRKI